jgi:hypothetical protein
MTDPGFENEHQPGKRNDPVLVALTSSPSVTETFLKSGESLKPIQRAGVCVISLLIIGWGIYFAADAFDGFQAGSPRLLASCAVSLFLIMFGTLGLRNALRFKRRKVDS